MIVGVGARRGVDASEVIEAIERALEEIGATLKDVNGLASADIKKDEKGLIEASEILGIPINFISHDEVNSCDVPSISQASRFGLKGVAEPSAIILSDKKELIMKKKAYGRVTIAIAE
ncbi:cobalamin biosynthesis protein [Methanohalophilus sp.]|uniref:cobalamin biosynthesis protein n=1 Tax=Methanohalophilus sp. TaxID=1966352 RepID=UPI0026112F78|nr:cobalamin biosynthesis protein [Methanohalophilus sp.]MDK2892752.1 cobalt-precorrin hydrolase [Methanohalophilus sp.]